MPLHDQPHTICGIVDPIDGRACDGEVAASAALNLCHRHLLAAYDQVVGEVGVTDVLPSPCVACGSRLGVHYASGWLCAVCEWRQGELPDGEIAGEVGDRAGLRVDVVYYLRERGLIKIGTSSNPRARLAQIPHDELLAFERGDRALEQQRHREFAACRAGREWFEQHSALLDHIGALQAGVSDPWVLHARWRSEAVALAGRARPRQCADQPPSIA